MHLTYRYKILFIVGLVLSFFYLHYFENRASVELDIVVTSRTWFKIYWAEEGKEFSENKRARIRVRPEQKHYRFFLTDIGDVERLRIDPHEYVGNSSIKRIKISQNYYKPLEFKSAEDFATFSPVFQVVRSTFDETKGLMTVSSGRDPAFKVLVSPVHSDALSYYSYMLARLLGIVFLVVVLLLKADSLLKTTDFIPVLMTVVFFLVLVMASISTPEVHPDEYVHFDASEYYTTNWIPPVVDSPSIRHTFSVYGVSRLNSHEVSYFFTGKFAELLAPFQIPDYLRYRFFNVILFGMILVSIFYCREVRLIALPFLLSPQIWYVFSYCNSDAFALTVLFFISCQLLLPKSKLNSYLFGDSRMNTLSSLLLMGLLCGFLLLLKKNYYIFIVFMGGYLSWKLWFQVESRQWGTIVKKVTVIAILGGLFMAGRFGLDYYVNGSERSIKIAELRVELADSLYNPETPLDKKHAFLYRKSRGDDWTLLIKRDRWLEKTFRSAVGMYGYFTVVAPDSYYDAFRWLSMLFVLFFVVIILIRGDPSEKVLFCVFLSCASGMVLISFWHSWTSDFQTQGRYLLPVVPMLSVLLYRTYHLFPRELMNLFFLAFFVVSSYSFIYIGLWQIPKMVGP